MGRTDGGPQPEPRSYQIDWRDLAATTAWDAVRELLLPLPWLIGSLILAEQRLYPLALIASFVFFLTGLRVVHAAAGDRFGHVRLQPDNAGVDACRAMEPSAASSALPQR